MKWVRLDNNVVREIIPDEATKPSIEHWYNAEFAAQCAEAPNEVGQHWTYDPTTGTYTPPAPPPPSDALTPAERRKSAYETLDIIEWQNTTITVNAAAALWVYYEAEGDAATGAQLTALIAAAKQRIRELYPDE